MGGDLEVDDTGREVKAAVGREEDESEAEARTTWQKSKESSPKRPSSDAPSQLCARLGASSASSLFPDAR